MQTFVPFFCRWLHRVALALWLGGLIAIGALVAPTAFHIIPHNPALAGAVVGGSLRLFNVLCLACGALMIIADGLLLAMGQARRATALGCIALTLLLLALTGYLGWSLFPAMDAAQAQNQMSLFDQLHHRYERLSGLQLPLLLLLAAAATARDSA
ncbi:MAG: DUF4149 domain-containing protein [Armatimonadetes bacterium]|nr:DUF4149 domain-containing protein [Armatimonadota bacterium]